MLILTRRIGESLVLGENILITVLAVNGAQVKLGIDAPKDINIVRTELLEKDRDLLPRG